MEESSWRSNCSPPNTIQQIWPLATSSTQSQAQTPIVIRMLGTHCTSSILLQESISGQKRSGTFERSTGTDREDQSSCVPSGCKCTRWFSRSRTLKWPWIWTKNVSILTQRTLQVYPVTSVNVSTRQHSPPILPKLSEILHPPLIPVGSEHVGRAAFVQVWSERAGHVHDEEGEEGVEVGLGHEGGIAEIVAWPAAANLGNWFTRHVTKRKHPRDRIGAHNDPLERERDCINKPDRITSPYSYPSRSVNFGIRRFAPNEPNPLNQHDQQQNVNHEGAVEVQVA